MGMDIQEAAVRALLHARELAELHPKTAHELSLNSEAFELAEEWYANPESSSHADHALKISQIIDQHSREPERDTYTSVFYRMARYGTFPSDQTSWHRHAMFAAQLASRGSIYYSPEETAVEHIAFLQRASQELFYLGELPMNPLYREARSLTHRLWSSERGEDTKLPQAVGIWFKHFVSETLRPSYLKNMQPATAKFMHRLPYSTDLANLSGPYNFRLSDVVPTNQPMVIDGFHLLLGRGARFFAYASPIPGSVILVDGSPANSGNLPWHSSLKRPIWVSENREIVDRLPGWLEANQDIITLAKILTQAGLMDVSDEIDVIYKGQEQRAIVTQFYDQFHWFNATDGKLPGTNYTGDGVPAKQYINAIELIAQAYIKLASLGFISLDPQYFIHKSGEVKITQLRNTYRMKAFPYKVFVEMVTTGTMRLGITQSEIEIVRSVVEEHLDRFILSGGLPDGMKIVNIGRFKAVQLMGKKGGGGTGGASGQSSNDGSPSSGGTTSSGNNMQSQTGFSGFFEIEPGISESWDDEPTIGQQLSLPGLPTLSGAHIPLPTITTGITGIITRSPATPR
jgi:hypothetical protein